MSDRVKHIKHAQKITGSTKYKNQISDSLRFLNDNFNRVDHDFFGQTMTGI